MTEQRKVIRVRLVVNVAARSSGELAEKVARIAKAANTDD